MQGLRSVFRGAVARPGVALTAIILIGFAVRVVALVATRPTGPAGDELELFVRAVRLVVGPPLDDDTARAPGLLHVYATAFRAFSPTLVVAKATNVVLSSVTVWPVYCIGRSLGRSVSDEIASDSGRDAGDRASRHDDSPAADGRNDGAAVGLAAASGVALYPNFVSFSHFLWSEPLFILLVTCGVAVLVRARSGDRSRDYAFAGVLLGLSALTKESGVLFAPLAAAYVLYLDRSEPRSAAIRALWLTGAFALIVLPWTLHINSPGQPFALVTRTGYMNLFIGNHPRGAGEGMREYPDLAPTRLEAEQIARQRALSEIRKRLPAWPLEKLAKEGPRFLVPTSFAVRRLLSEPDAEGNWGYRASFELGNRRGPRIAAVVVVVGSYVVVMLAGVAGLVLARRRELSGLFLVFFVSQLVPSLVTFSMSRFRLPSMVFMIIGAALLLVSGREDYAAASRVRRVVAVGMTAGVGLLIAMGYETVLRPSGG